MIFRDKYVKRYFFFSLLFFILLTVIWKIDYFTNSHKSQALRVKKELLQLDNSFHSISKNVLQAMEIDSLLSWDNISGLINDKKIGVTVFNCDSLIYWNSNKLNPSGLIPIKDNQLCLLSFNNTRYIVFSRRKAGWRVILYRPVDVDIANYIFEYLGKDNSFNVAHIDSCFNLKSFIIIQNHYNANNNNFKEIKSNNSSALSPQFSMILFISWLGGFVLLELLVIRLHQLVFRNTNIIIRYLFLFIDIAILFVLISVWGVPTIFKENFWFEKWHQIVPFIGSRGLAILFVSFIIVLSIEFNRIGFLKSGSVLSNFFNVSIIALYNFFVLFSLLYIFNSLYNKSIQPNSSAIGFILQPGFLELYFISGIVVSIFFFQKAFLGLLKFTKGNALLYSTLVAIFTMIAFLFTKLPPQFFLSLFLILIFSVLISYYTVNQATISFLRYLLLTVLFAIGFSIIINNSYSRFINHYHHALVSKLANTRSIYIEKDFKRLKDSIAGYQLFSSSMVDSIDEDTLLNKLKSKYINAIFKDCEVQLTICHKYDSLQLNSDSRLVGCKDYFDNLKLEPEAQMIDSSLFLLDPSAESRYYLGEIPLWSDTSDITMLYVEMFSSMLPKGLGYIELLDDKNKQIDLSGYSIAKFHKNELVYKTGEYEYHRNYSFMRTYPNDKFFLLNKYIHYKIRLNNTDILIVSRPARTVAEKMATFSMLFILFSFLSIILYFATIGWKDRSKLKYSFQTRLQLFIMATLALLFILLSIVSGYYFSDIRKTFIVNQLNEKTKSVLLELQDRFSDYDFNTGLDKEYLQEQLKRLSILFFSDINIYDRSGELIATSRPKIFEKGLLSTLVNPVSYQQVMINKKLFYLTTEKIKSVTFYSAYMPLSFDAGSPVGILNLPYFAHQSEVNKSFMPLLYNYLNIFVIIGVIGAFLALLIAKLLTKPLTMLKQSLSKIGIDKKNEPLEWKNDDEIGHLIAEYNLMVKKLEASAALLKRSERELTWREVAQQVAHEIRNPLTPMKLNIQYLQKVYKESNDNFDEKWNTLSASLIDQIDALNEVASTFSELAGNNTVEKEKIDLIQLILSAIDLYKNNEKVSIEFETTLPDAIVYGRPSELLRVFNNLIKNAVQSVLPKGGYVKIVVTKKRDKFEIAIIDNGRGIPNAMKERIFQPYFTTKSGGTGIGLAIVKNIISEMGGEVVFISKENRGSEFIVRLSAIE